MSKIFNFKGLSLLLSAFLRSVGYIHDQHITFATKSRPKYQVECFFKCMYF
ncbi:hypothetical protein LguiA_016614 [Lonicera macranthoides]